MVSLREVRWGLFLAGLPFAHFLVYSTRVNQWHAQGLWLEAGSGTLFALALARGAMFQIANRPLGYWVAWVLLSTAGLWLTYLQHGWGHPIGVLSPLVHLSIIPMFYLAALTDWNLPLLRRLLTWLAFAGVALVAYGMLQVANLDQFYKWVDSTKTMQGKDSLIGTVGNNAYYGIHLALLVPVWLWQPRRRLMWFLVALAASALIVLTDSTSALACGLAAWGWWLWQTLPRRWAMLVGGVLGGLALWWVLAHPGGLNPSGRLEAWSAFWQQYMVGDGKQQITGAGVGRIMGDSALGLPGWPGAFRHAHCEFFHVMIEQGVIGLGLVGWALWAVWQRWRRLPRTDVALVLGGMGMLFVMACLVNNCAHNAILGSLGGLLPYAGIYVLSAEATV